ncbi:MAG: chemotaxis protein CheW, partial [Cyanobacteria bacterium P01_H01_bin.15]
NVDTLIREPAAVANVSELDAEAELPLLPTNFFDLYCPGVSPQAQSLFEARTAELQTGQSQILAEQTREIAVFRLGEEYFGFEAAQVREFIKVPPLTPIPCCPNHILGNANLRGEVITLVDIAHCLSLPMVEANPLSPAIVVTVGEFTVAIAADEILDVQVVPSSSINPLPSVMPRPGSDFLQGTARFATRTLSLLDLEKLLIEGDLMVDEPI